MKGDDFMSNYSPATFAKKIGVSVKTLQRWDKLSYLTAFRYPSNRRYYTEAHENIIANKRGN